MAVHRALDPPGYTRRRPERTPLWRAVCLGIRTVLLRADADGTGLPGYVRRELDGYLRCGLLAFGFARVWCRVCEDDLFVALSCKGRGFCPSCAGRRMADTAARLVDSVLPDVPVRQWVLSVPFGLRFRLACDAALTSALLAILIEEVTRKYRELAQERGHDHARCGAVTSIQRFGSALNLDVHFHTLFLDGAYVPAADGSPRWLPLLPSDDDVRDVALRVAERGDALLLASQRPRILDEHPNLARIAQLSLTDARIDEPTRPKPTRNSNPLPRKHMAMRVGQWDLHAATSVPQGHRAELERLCKYIFRSPLAMERMELRPDGQIAYRLRKPRFDGSTEIVLAPEDLVVRLIAMLPPPYSNQTRYHGVLAPAAKDRDLIVPEARQRPCRRATKPMRGPGPDARLPWAELLRRTFRIDVLRCARCGGRRTVIGMVTERAVARRILDHLGESSVIARLAPARGPPDE